MQEKKILQAGELKFKCEDVLSDNPNNPVTDSLACTLIQNAFTDQGWSCSNVTAID